MSSSNSTKTHTTSTVPTNPFAAFASVDPMALWTQSQQAFADACSHAQSYADQYAQLEAQLVARVQLAVATMSQLAQDTIAYAAQLSAEARKLGLAATRKMTQA